MNGVVDASIQKDTVVVGMTLRGGEWLNSCLAFFPDPTRKEDSPTTDRSIRIILLLLLRFVFIGIFTVIGWLF